MLYLYSMNAKLNEKLKKLVEEKGYREACELISLKMYDLATLTDLKIEGEFAQGILFDLLDDNKIPTTYEDFNIKTRDIEDIIIWENESVAAEAMPFYKPNQLNVWMFIYTNENNDEKYFHGEIPNSYIMSKCKGSFDNLEEFITWIKDYYYPTSAKMIAELISLNNDSTE